MRGLGVWSATAIVVGTMMETGIFIVPSAMARDTGSIALVFVVWIAAGFLSLFGALTYAELGAARWLTVAMILCALGTLNSSILSGTRVPYAMARDGLFFNLAAHVDQRFRSPSGALLLQGVMASLLALSGTFGDSYALFIFSQWIVYGLCAATVLPLRWKEPELERPCRTWGYPVVPPIFVLSALGLTLSILVDRPVRSSLGLLLILSGLLLRRLWRQRSGSE